MEPTLYYLNMFHYAETPCNINILKECGSSLPCETISADLLPLLHLIWFYPIFHSYFAGVDTNKACKQGEK